MYNQTKTQTTSNDENKKRKLNENSSDSSGEESLSAGFVPFLVVEPVDKVNKINHSIFAVQKFATCSIGSIKSAKKLRSGSVLLEVRDHHQYDLAMALTKWVDVDVKVTEHRGLNSSRGVIRSRELRDCPDDEVLEALQSQKVTAVHHIKTKKDGLELPTNTFILTFRSPNPPTHITAAYMRLPVERYIPNPLRCYNCQKYGHSKTTCNRPAACARCGQEGHGDTDCSAPEHCCNCKGSHTAYSKQCPEWQRQRDITRIKFEKNISFAEAQQLYKTTHTPVGTKTYAAAAKTTQSMGTQTDFTWPEKADKPTLMSKSVSAGCQTQAPVASSTNTATTTSKPTPTATLSKHAPSTPSSHTTTTPNTPAAPASSSASKQAKPANNQQQNKGNAKTSLSSTKPSKGSDDPIKLHNKFGATDNMEVDDGPNK